MRATVPREEQDRTVSISFTLQYGDKLSPAERKPQLYCYFSDPIQESGTLLELPEDDAGRSIPVTVRGTLDRDALELPVDTKLVFYATCEKDNNFGSPCRVDAGFGTLNLRDMITTKSFTRDVALRLNTTGYIEKGRLRISIAQPSSQVDISARIQWEHSPISRAIQTASSTGTLLPVETEMLNYIRSVMQMEMSLPNTFPPTSNVRMPIYYGDVGMMKRDTPLPAAAFVLCKTPRSNLRFWVNALEIVQARRNMVVHDVDRMSLKEQALVMADMVCLVVQAMDYISDTVDGNRRFIHAQPGFIGSGVNQPFDLKKILGCERFGDALRDICGDCEDLGLAIAQIVFALCEANVEGHPQLACLQKICRQYVPILTLDSVTAAAVRAEGQPVKLGAHIKCVLISGHDFKKQLEKGIADMAPHHSAAPGGGGKAVSVGGGEAVAALINGQMSEQEFASLVIGEGIAGAQNLPFEPFEPWAKDLPVLVGEGTGMFQTPNIIDDPVAAERSVVYRGMPSLGPFKKEIICPPGTNPAFYVGSMVWFTSYFAQRGANVCGGLVGYSDGATGQFQRGVHFQHLINKSPEVSFLPHPPFSDACMEWMRRATRIRVPPRDLVLTDAGIAAQPERNPTIDALIEHVNAMERPAEHPQMAPIHVFMQSHQLTAKCVAALRRDVERNPAITHMSAVCEHLTDWLHMYRVNISANT